MISLTPEAAAQVEALADHFAQAGRIQAIKNLAAALEAASAAILADPAGGLAAPRPYPELAQTNRLWRHEGRYWIAYRPVRPPIILGIFYDAANIPGRIAPQKP